MRTLAYRKTRNRCATEHFSVSRATSLYKKRVWMISIPLWIAWLLPAMMLGLGIVLGVWSGRYLRVIAQRAAAAELAQWQFRAEEAVQIAEQLTEQHQRDGVELHDWQKQLEAERRKSAGYFETIESVLRQRQTWETLYNTQAVEHGNAQALMMDAIGYLSGRLKQAGIEVKIPPLLQEVQGLYQEAHVFPVTQALRDPSREPIETPSGRDGDAIPKPSPFDGDSMSLAAPLTPAPRKVV